MAAKLLGWREGKDQQGSGGCRCFFLGEVKNMLVRKHRGNLSVYHRLPGCAQSTQRSVPILSDTWLNPDSQLKEASFQATVCRGVWCLWGSHHHSCPQSPSDPNSLPLYLRALVGGEDLKQGWESILHGSIGNATVSYIHVCLAQRPATSTSFVRRPVQRHWLSITALFQALPSSFGFS